MQRRKRGSYRIWILMGDARRPQERSETSGAWDLNLAPAMESFSRVVIVYLSFPIHKLERRPQLFPTGLLKG